MASAGPNGSADRPPEDIIVINYLKEKSSLFRDLYAACERVCHIFPASTFGPFSLTYSQGWNNPTATKHFEEQRQQADSAGIALEQVFYSMMSNNAKDLDAGSSSIFRISRKPTKEEPRAIVDFCMAPGAFLSMALTRNFGAQAVAFTLPQDDGGHHIILPLKSNVKLHSVDITMLAADMGVDSIPSAHEDAGKFLPRALAREQMFDLAICDGAVLRNHVRASYRQAREGIRLLTVQLALGLEHLRPGGTMIVLLHKLDTWHTFHLVQQMSKIAEIRLLKPIKAHAKRSSFYMVASDVRSEHARARQTVTEWKKLWHVATFGSDLEYKEAMHTDETVVRSIVNDFGGNLMKLASSVFETQRAALAKQSWAK